MTDSPRLRMRIGFLPTYRWKCSDWCRALLQDSVKALSAAPDVELVRFSGGQDGSICNLDEAEGMAAEFRRENVDAVVVCALNFGDERAVAKVAELLRVPVMLYATKEPPARTDTTLARISDSYCGNLTIAAAMQRRHIPFHFAGIFLPQEKEFGQAVETFVRAVSVVKGFRNARIGQVGVRPQTFESVACDEIALAAKFGQNVILRNVEEIIKTANDLPADDPTLQRTIKEIIGSVAQVTVKPEGVDQVARIECALADFYEKERLSVMAVQCWPTFGRNLKIDVCSTFGRLTGRHLLTACETDVLGGLSMLASYRAALGAALPHFVDWTIQHREDPNRLLAWHCGNAPVCLAADPAKTALRARWNMKGEYAGPSTDSGALFHFQVKPGAVTFCRVAELDGEWKMLIAPGRIVPADEMHTGTWSWVEVRDHDRLYRTLVEEGFVHHASMIHGDQKESLVTACKFLGVKAVVVD